MVLAMADCRIKKLQQDIAPTQRAVNLELDSIFPCAVNHLAALSGLSTLVKTKPDTVEISPPPVDNLYLEG